MSSFPRRLQRKALRSRPDYEPRPQPTVVLADGGYRTLRPTKGWVTLSGKRLAAQRRMAQLLDHVLPARRRKPAKVWRRPAPAAPSVETRQQRRAVARVARP